MFALIIGRVLVVLDESNLIRVSSKDASHRDTAHHGPKQQPQQSKLHGFWEHKTQEELGDEYRDPDAFINKPQRPS